MIKSQNNIQKTVKYTKKHNHTKIRHLLTKDPTDNRPFETEHLIITYEQG